MFNDGDDCEMRNGVDETEIHPLVEYPLCSPQRFIMDPYQEFLYPCQEYLSPEIFHLLFDPYWSTTPPITTDTSAHDFPSSSSSLGAAKRNDKFPTETVHVNRRFSIKQQMARDVARAVVAMIEKNRKRIRPPFQRLQELPAEHHLSLADICNLPGSSISCHDVLPQDTGLIGYNMLSPASPDLCPAKDLSSSSMHKESLEAGGCAFQMIESTPSAACSTPSALMITEPFSDQGGMLSENMGSSNDLRYLSPSATEAVFEGQIPESTRTEFSSDPAVKQAMAILPHSGLHVTTRTNGENITILQTEIGTPRCCYDLQSKTMRGSIPRVDISNQDLPLQQQTPASARDLNGSFGDIIPRQIQELPSSTVGSTHGGLMPSENVGISLNNLTISTAEEFSYHRSEFTTSETFESRDALQKWCCEVGSSNGFKVVVKRSDSGNGTKIESSTLVCERSGHYRGKGKNTELHQDKKLTTTATKKCKCPFELKCKMTDGSWTLQVIRGEHNHQCSTGFENSKLQGKKISSSCNIPSIGGQDETGRQMFDSSLTTNEGEPWEKNRLQPNFGKGSSRLRTMNASNVGSIETSTCLKAQRGRLEFPEPLPQTTSTEIVSVKATYRKDTVKFDLSLTSGIDELKKQVSNKLELELGSFRVKYKDGDKEWIVISCDEDFQVCVKMSSSLPNKLIRLKVTDKSANSGKFCRCRGLKRKRSSKV